MPYFLFLLLVVINSPNYSAYIDTRDMTQESIRIQRLLGRLDALKITPPNNNQYSGPNGTQIAMLSMMTAGLALSTSGSYIHTYYSRPYYNRRSYYTRSYRNPTATAIGATMTTIGLLGLIGSAAAEENRQQAQQQQQLELKKIETEVNTIISNLVVTDMDFITENNELNNTLSQSVDQNILEIAQITSNDINIIMQEEKKVSDDFTKNTNTLTKDIETLEKNTMEAVSYNIDKMSSPNITKTAVKELKTLNKTLNKQLKLKQKEFKSQIKQEVKSFNQNYPDLQKKNSQTIRQLEESQDKRILNELEYAQTKKSDLFQKYISSYINKLAAY